MLLGFAYVGQSRPHGSGDWGWKAMYIVACEVRERWAEAGSRKQTFGTGEMSQPAPINRRQANVSFPPI
ncbi:MAG: hypothetical protein ACK53I_06415 [Phenylobacterium sp.]